MSKGNILGKIDTDLRDFLKDKKNLKFNVTGWVKLQYPETKSKLHNIYVRQTLKKINSEGYADVRFFKRDGMKVIYIINPESNKIMEHVKPTKIPMLRLKLSLITIYDIQRAIKDGYSDNIISIRFKLKEDDIFKIRRHIKLVNSITIVRNKFVDMSEFFNGQRIKKI